MLKNWPTKIFRRDWDVHYFFLLRLANIKYSVDLRIRKMKSKLFGLFEKGLLFSLECIYLWISYIHTHNQIFLNKQQLEMPIIYWTVAQKLISFVIVDEWSPFPNVTKKCDNQAKKKNCMCRMFVKFSTILRSKPTIYWFLIVYSNNNYFFYK